MNLRDYGRVLREQWRAVLMLAVVGLIVGAVSYIVIPLQYTSSTSVYVSAQNLGPNAQTAYQGAQFSEQRVISYVQLVATPRVADEVQRRLQLPSTPIDEISATSAVESVIIDIFASARTAEEARAIADGSAQVLQEVVAEIERPLAPGGTPPVVLRVVQPATLALGASSPSFPLLCGLGLMVGLMLGLVTAFIRASLDTRIKAADELGAITNVSNLATIPSDPLMQTQSITVESTNYSISAESYRQLRTNLQFVGVDRRTSVFVITSALPGEGKSVSTLNLAMSMAVAGSRVLVISGDLRRPRLAEMLGFDDSVGLTTVLTGRIGLSEAVQRYRQKFDLLLSGVLPPNPSELLGSDSMSRLLQDAKRYYDIVLIDTPPALLVSDAVAVAPSTDGVLLLTRHNYVKSAQVRQAKDNIENGGGHLLGTVLTAYRGTSRGDYSKYGSYQTYEQREVRAQAEL